MYDVVLSTQFRTDVFDIANFIAADDPGAAKRVSEQLRLAALSLREFPFRYAEWRYGYRRLIVGNHLIFYRIDEPRKQVLIARAMHGAIDFEGLFGPDPES